MVWVYESLKRTNFVYLLTEIDQTKRTRPNVNSIYRMDHLPSEPTRLSRSLNPDIKTVTCTVTEKGYHMKEWNRENDLFIWEI